ncbi:hypothetical protein [Enterobacter ludwigii]|uniref:hypothetical protein n=1 Tax=Enterobacter ludwigii TaxID=299767 RepID=UPI003976D075
MAKGKHYKIERSGLSKGGQFEPEEQTKENEVWQKMLRDARHNKANKWWTNFVGCIRF